MAVRITKKLLCRLRQLSNKCAASEWVILNQEVLSVNHSVAECGRIEDAEFIAEADPETILALIDRIEELERQIMPVSVAAEDIKCERRDRVSCRQSCSWG